MKKENVNDWKDVANSYFDKCIALIILFLMFFFIVYPNVETKAVRTVDRTIEVIDWIPEEQEQIIQEHVIERLIINIEIVDEDDGDDDEDIIILETIDVTTRPADLIIDQTPERTSRFVIYEVAPVAISRVQPVYPEWARRANIQGTVVLDIEILIDGSIGAIDVLQSLQSGPGGLDEIAIEAARKWRFQPAKSGGNPVACWITQPFHFTLN